jgi:hypothetical protein
VTFDLAANPQIDEPSIVVDGTNNVITVNVNNMGDTVLNTAVLVVSQDSTINEGDKGYYGVAYFDNQAGLQSGATNKITITGQTQTLTTLAITETNTGMSKVTKLTFSSINLANTNPVNVSLFVGNSVEGSDSCAVANKAISYPTPLYNTFVSTNLLARYDASVASSYTLSGGNVTTWNDLTGNSYHLIANGTGPTVSTINTIQAFNFNSGRGLKYSSMPLAANITVFMVAKYSTFIGSWGNFMHHGNRDMDWSIRRNGGNNTIDFSSGQGGTTELPVANDKNYIFVGRIVGTDSTATKQFWVYSDTSPAVQYVTNPPVTIDPGNKPLYVGMSDATWQNESCNSTIGEILYYNASLSDVEVTKNVGYLHKKWFNINL